MDYVWLVATLIHCCSEVSTRGVRVSYIDGGRSVFRTTNFRKLLKQQPIGKSLKGRTGPLRSQCSIHVQNTTEICKIVTQANADQFTAIQSITEGEEDNHKGLFHARKALDAYLKISNGNDHPGVAVLLRLVATLSQGELSRSEVQSLVTQAQNMWSRMYDGTYRVKLDERFKKTFNFVRREEHFKEFEGLLTEKDCERIINWAQSRILAQDALSEKINKAWEEGKFNVKYYDAYNQNIARGVGNQDRIDLKFYESVLLTRVFLSTARLTGVPLNRITDLSVHKLTIGSKATDLNKLDFYVSDKESSHVEYSLTIFLNDDFDEGQMCFPYIENDVRDYLVKPKAGKAVWIREKDQSRFDVLKSTMHRHFAPSSGIRDKWIMRVGIGSENYANWIDFGNLDPLTYTQMGEDPLDLEPFF